MLVPLTCGYEDPITRSFVCFQLPFDDVERVRQLKLHLDTQLRPILEKSGLLIYALSAVDVEPESSLKEVHLSGRSFSAMENFDLLLAHLRKHDNPHILIKIGPRERIFPDFNWPLPILPYPVLPEHEKIFRVFEKRIGYLKSFPFYDSQVSILPLCRLPN